MQFGKWIDRAARHAMATVLLAGSSALAGSAAAEVLSVRVLGFEPSRNGLQFDNSFPSEPDFTLNLLGHKLKLGNAANGLCGGFAFTAADLYEARALPPKNTNADLPKPGSPVFNYLVARLVNSFTEDNVNQYLSWIQMNDDDNAIGHGLAWHEITEEWPKIKAGLESNHIVPLGLVHGKEPGTIGFFTGMKDLGGCHQVAAYGYDLDGSKLTIHIYDPNYSGNNNCTITLDIRNPHHTTPIQVSNHPGEFRGFFHEHYTYHDPHTPAEGSFVETVVRSPNVQSSGQWSPNWVDRTLIWADGTPIIRFTGHDHDWTSEIAPLAADGNAEIIQLRAVIKTGSDDIRGGNNPDDNADVFIKLRNGQTLELRNVNNGMHWNNEQVHEVALPLPPRTRIEDLVEFRLHTHFDGGISGDNWNVDEIRLIAAISAHGRLPEQFPMILEANGGPLVRFTGDRHDWESPVRVSPAEANRPLQRLSVTIRTGGDDLRAGDHKGDNANVSIKLHNGRTLEFENINQGHRWGNNETHTVQLPISSGLKAGEIAEFKLHTHFGGGIGGDNWNVDRVELRAQL